MFYTAYQLVSWLLFIVAAPFFLLYILTTGKHRQGLKQRLGFLPEIGFPKNKTIRIWLHAASVGEVQVARALIAQIHQALPEAAIILSTVTRQGYAVANNQLPEDVVCIFAPLDLMGIVNLAINKIRPDIYICLETEIWPNILKQVGKFGAKIILLNGRLSENSFAGYSRIKPFIKEILAGFSLVAVIHEGDAARYKALGVAEEKLRILGNAKYDLTAVQTDPQLAGSYRAILGLHQEQPVLVTGSTHTGEEKLLIDVFRSIQQRLPDLVWVVAPRHLRRLEEIERLLDEHEIAHQRLSNIKEHGRTTDVVLVDYMGELANIYSIARYVFCGGSLVDRGGHNVLEAAVWGRPVFYGPSMKDFTDAKELLESKNAGFSVCDPMDLAAKIIHFEDHPQEYEAAGKRALQVARTQIGSADKQVALIKEVLAGTRP